MGTLRRSLSTLSVEDRLAAAWLVACGKALANRSTVISCEDAIVRIEVLDSAWLEEFAAMKECLKLELARISGVPVHELHFIVKR
jgi:hypothetical protein